MAKRGSNIYKRKDGRFEGRVHVGYKADGSKKYRSVYGKTLAEVKEKMADLYAVRTEKNISAIRLTVREAADQWLSAARLRVKESSYANYENILNNHILPILGGEYISSLTTGRINDFIHYIALIQLLNSKEYEKAEKQLEKLLSQTQSKIIYSTSGNVVVDGLINYKLQNAVNDGIDVKTEIAIPVNLKVDTSDIVTIIGNLLDNSLTALKNIPKGERNLLLKIVFSKERLIIRVANPFTGQIKYKDNKIISSKTNDGKHGYGLNNIYKAIEKYNGYMEIDHANQLFTVDIIIYVNSVAD